MRGAVWSIVAILAMTAGCGKREVEHQGLPLSEWVERLSSRLMEERRDAVKAIGEIGVPARKAEDKLRAIARRDNDVKIRLEAVHSLAKIGASTEEFADFVREMEAPLFIEEEDTLETEVIDVDSEVSLSVSDEEDLRYLQDLAEGRVDTTPLQGDTGSFPSGEDERQEWSADRRAEHFATVLNQLQNPMVLAEIVRTGSVEERRLAARMLAGRSGIDAIVFDALEGAKSDTDSLVRAAVADALKKWAKP
ncbi:MAG: hypothetical protein FJY67_07040 [Calditrichaeota bacterium]|nr:hypothetical protein [Calditrichota bacterium]